MHTRAFSNVLDEFLIKLKVKREREREREQVLGHRGVGHDKTPYKELS